MNDVVAGARFNLCLKCGKLFPIKDWNELSLALDGKLPPHDCPEKTAEEWKAEFARQQTEREQPPAWTPPDGEKFEPRVCKAPEDKP